MASFSVKGPFVVPCTKMKVGRAITPEDIAAFWAARPALATERGCYLFGFRAAKGSKPIYVGKATKSFKQEVFTDHKLKKYAVGFGNQAKGTPIMFLICLNKSKGAVNHKANWVRATSCAAESGWVRAGQNHFLAADSLR